MGFYQLTVTGPYLVGCVLYPLLFKNTPRRIQFVLCYAISSIAELLMGPIFLPDKLYFVVIGYIMMGSVQCLSFIPPLPEAIDQMLLRY